MGRCVIDDTHEAFEQTLKIHKVFTRIKSGRQR
jgi:hypothetical protein